MRPLLLLLLLALPACLAEYCLFESARAVAAPEALSQEAARAGCVAAPHARCADRPFPLLSLRGVADLDELQVFQASAFHHWVGGCGAPRRLLSASFWHALERPTWRSLADAGLDDPRGYWTNSDKGGQYLARAYTPTGKKGASLLGGHVAPPGDPTERKWLCACLV